MQTNTDRTAIVTGCTKGIGRAVSEALLDLGYGVCGCARNMEDLDRMEQQVEGDFLGVSADVRQRSACETVYRKCTEQFGRVDVLVNNAGVGEFEEVHELSDEQWDRVIQTNLTGAFYMSRAVLPHMYERGSGYIFNIASLADNNTFEGGGAYCASKHGLYGLSEVLFKEARERGVKVSCISPGSVATHFGGDSPEDRPDEENLWKQQPEDIAKVVTDLLASSDHVLISRVEMRPSFTKYKKPE